VSSRGHSRARVAIVLIVALAIPRLALAQQTVRDVLSFLLTNRSIPTDDFVRDEQAAVRTADAISDFLLVELATLPITSSAGGFTYRLDPTLGTMTRASDSFGPFFAERSLTIGKERASFGVSYQSAAFEDIDGRNLRDGTLVSTASVLATEATPFDVETVTLRIRTDTVTVVGNYGITDRFDVSGAVPFVRLQLNGQRVDTYRGQPLVQAIGSASTSGLGDLVVRAKYNVLRGRSGGLAVGAEARLPTGAEENLLGAGEAAVKPRAAGSYEAARVGLHGDVGYSFGGLAREFDYGGAVTLVASPRLTFVAELAGRRLDAIGRLTDTTEPHPRLANVTTIRLTSVEQATNRLLSVVGVKWNVGGAWLLSANVRRPLMTAGVNTSWVPTLTVDYSIGR
jgi:hypothetical protein